MQLIMMPSLTFLRQRQRQQNCGADCEAAVRSYLPVGTAGASIKAGGQTVGQGTVLVNEFGILVLVGANNSDPTFVSACKAEIPPR